MKVGENRDFVGTRKLHNHCRDLVNQLHTSYIKVPLTGLDLTVATKKRPPTRAFSAAAVPPFLSKVGKDKGFKQAIEFVVTSCNLHHGHRC